MFSRQHKLEEALLFSGQFMDALQALVDWLYKVEPQLAEDQPVHGDLDLVMNLMDAHKVRAPFPSSSPRPEWGLSSPRAKEQAQSRNACPAFLQWIKGGKNIKKTGRTSTLLGRRQEWSCLTLLSFWCVHPGVPEGAGEAHGDSAGAEALGPGAHRQQPGRHHLGEGAAAGAEQPLGHGVQAVCVQANPPGTGPEAGEEKSVAGNSLGVLCWAPGLFHTKLREEVLPSPGRTHQPCSGSCEAVGWYQPVSGCFSEKNEQIKAGLKREDGKISLMCTTVIRQARPVFASVQRDSIEAKKMKKTNQKGQRLLSSFYFK